MPWPHSGMHSDAPVPLRDFHVPPGAEALEPVTYSSQEKSRKPIFGLKKQKIIVF